MIKILHLVWDSMFVDNMIKKFDALQNVENIFLYAFSYNGPCTLKKVKNKDRITFANSKNEFYSYFKDESVNIVLLHALITKSYTITKHLPEKTKLIWWAYGYDLYNTKHFAPPLLRTELFLPLTKKTWPVIKYRLQTIASYITGIISGEITQRKRLINRVDFTSTVFPIEYDMLLKLPYFRARKFMIRGLRSFQPSTLSYKEEPGSILVGHSAVPWDNQIDIINKLQLIDLRKRNVIFPINYGYSYWQNHLKEFNHRLNCNVIFLDKILSRDDYGDMIDSCTHAIFGNLRQTAVGNFHLCVKKGIKVFFSKYSANYIQFKQDGYILFTIEDDLNQSELEMPLSKKDADYNYNTFYKVLKHKDSNQSTEYLQHQVEMVANHYS